MRAAPRLQRQGMGEGVRIQSGPPVTPNPLPKWGGVKLVLILHANECRYLKARELFHTLLRTGVGAGH
jgi:hypothetical protein